MKSSSTEGFEATWCKEYQANKYLRKASTDQLEKRLLDLKTNLWSTDRDGEVTQLRFLDHRIKISQLILHVLLEKSERQSISEIIFEEKTFREEVTVGYVPPNLKVPILGDRGVFAKFGHHPHILETFRSGRIRIAPAASYQDSSLNSAQQDDELCHWTRTPNKALMIQVTDVDGKHIPLQMGEFLQGKTIQNYLVWCCACGYEARLFKDFACNAAIIVREEKEFIDRLTKATKQAIPDFNFLHGPVGYYDPYHPPSDGIRLPFMKNMKYLYQNEYRFIWQSDDPIKHIPTFLELGPLEDIAELVELK